MTAKAKAWAARLPLDDLRGLQLLGAALYHAALWRADTARGSIALHRSLTDQAEPDGWGSLLCPFEQERVRTQEAEARRLRIALEGLDTPPATISAGANARLSDFRFCAADLFRYQRLVLFLRAPRWAHTVKVDRETPICRNSDLQGSGTVEPLFWDCYRWHMARPDDADWHVRPFPLSAEEYVFAELVADLCELPKGPGAPKGARHDDSRHDAASYAWSLRQSEGLSNDEAARRSLECFEIVHRAPVPKSGGIVANSYKAAFDRVRECLSEIDKRDA
jgi:hypothetical protein